MYGEAETNNSLFFFMFTELKDEIYRPSTKPDIAATDSEVFTGSVIV